MQKNVVVVLPGILGSTLTRDGSEVWGTGLGTITSTLLSLGKNFRQLKLPSGIGHDDPRDGINAGQLMPSTTLVPGFWNLIDGYSELVRKMEVQLSLRRSTVENAGNLIEFAYDWRLSNQLNGRRLADRVIPELERWRKETGYVDAKLVFVCHSMGGLIARWFIEVLGGAELTERLITIGTPHRGSINALDSLANGFAPGIGAMRVNLDSVLRSFPSVYQLLPTYNCVDIGQGKLVALSAIEIPNISSNSIKEAFEFHSRITEGTTANKAYDIHALKGVTQPTSQSARLSHNQIQAIRDYKGENKGGDGTVPRPSAHPQEWEDETRSLFYGQSHGALQNNSDTIRQVCGILSGNLGSFMGGARIGVDMPDMFAVGQNLKVTAFSEDEDPTLPLKVNITNEQNSGTIDVLMRSIGDGVYSGTISDLSAGAYRVTVRSASPQRPVDEVTNITLAWDKKSE